MLLLFVSSQLRLSSCYDTLLILLTVTRLFCYLIRLAKYCDVFRHFPTYHDVLRRLATYYNALRRITTYHDVWRRIRTYHYALQRITKPEDILRRAATFDDTLQRFVNYHRVAAYCDVILIVKCYDALRIIAKVSRFILTYRDAHDTFGRVNSGCGAHLGFSSLTKQIPNDLFNLRFHSNRKECVRNHNPPTLKLSIAINGNPSSPFEWSRINWSQSEFITCCHNQTKSVELNFKFFLIISIYFSHYSLSDPMSTSEYKVRRTFIQCHLCPDRIFTFT